MTPEQDKNIRKDSVKPKDTSAKNLQNSMLSPSIASPSAIPQSLKFHAQKQSQSSGQQKDGGNFTPNGTPKNKFLLQISETVPSTTGSKMSKLSQTKSLTKIDRSRSVHFYRAQVQAGVPESQIRKPNRLMQSDGKCQRVWEICAKVLSCYIPNIYIEKVLKKSDPGVKQAYREKVALVNISFLMCVFLCFFTFFYQSTSCSPPNETQFKYSELKNDPSGRVSIYGNVYDTKKNDWSSKIHPEIKNIGTLQEIFQSYTPYDVSEMFTIDTPSCGTFDVKPYCDYSLYYDASGKDKSALQYCHKLDQSLLDRLKEIEVGMIYYSWDDIISNSTYKSNFVVYNGLVLNFERYLRNDNDVFGPEIDQLIRSSLGTDASANFGKHKNISNIVDCLSKQYVAGVIDKDNLLCIAANTILNIALIMICSLVVARFILAVFFGWFLSWQLGKIQASRNLLQIAKNRGTEEDDTYFKSIGTGVTAATHPQSFSLFHKIDFNIRYRELYTMCLVTAYSEGEEGLRTTIDSLCQTDYHDNYKLIFVVADGIVKGAGNAKPTGDIVLDMMNLDEAIHGPVSYEKVKDEKTGHEKEILKCRNAEPKSYKAIGGGSKSHNMAKIYCGTYQSGNRRVAMILVYKWGTPAEQDQAKPGNRGKRDSQIVLMDFLSKVMFDEALSPMQYDLFLKWSHIMTVQNDGLVKVTPDMFEIVLMVDADTKVLPDSLSRMVSVMQRDPSVMGLCGETRIMNKNESWVSKIQVFEYYTSHHLDKAFESIFGGVTCLPGCFCMYRIKAPRPLPQFLRDEQNPEELCDWVPIISNPDIVADYSESNVDTLHKKNLLLLGEDRYLTTLMLRTFPKRKMMFVPKALCKTQVPAQFQVLLSQRRRWINSTVHNLLELILVRELCGIFCFSMQFVVFLGLVGTATLPAAIIFTMVMIIRSIIGPPQWVPIALLGAILGLPAILIIFTTRKMVYLWYMLVYLLALPIWNFVLPTYAFWNFDDFSWGQTRQVAGEKKGEDSHGHGGTGEKTEQQEITTKRWVEWEKERVKELKASGQSDYFGKCLMKSDGLTKFGVSKKRNTLMRFLSRKSSNDMLQKSADMKQEDPQKDQANGQIKDIDTKPEKIQIIPTGPKSADLALSPATNDDAASSAVKLPSPMTNRGSQKNNDEKSTSRYSINRK